MVRLDGSMRILSVYRAGQESNHTTWLLAKMNLANPPFNVFDWGGERPSRRRPQGYEPCSEWFCP